MEKVKVDTEIRKLDQLRSAHINQQHAIRWEVRQLPEQIRQAKQAHERITADIATGFCRSSSDKYSRTVRLICAVYHVSNAAPLGKRFGDFTSTDEYD